MIIFIVKNELMLTIFLCNNFYLLSVKYFQYQATLEFYMERNSTTAKVEVIFQVFDWICW